MVAGDYRSISFNFGLVASLAGKFFDVAVFAIDVLFLLVVRPGRSLCRCTIVLSFLNEEQMLAAWLSDWAPSLARRYASTPKNFSGAHACTIQSTSKVNGTKNITWKSDPAFATQKLLRCLTADIKTKIRTIAGLSLRQNQNCIRRAR